MYLHPLLSTISAEERADLVRHIELRSYKRSEVVKDVNDRAASIYCVATGLLRVVVAGSGREEEVTTDFLKSGELYLASAFDETRHLNDASLVAALPSSVYIVPCREFVGMCSRHPDVLVALVGVAVRRSSMLRKQLRRVSSLASETLIGRALHELTQLAPAGDSGYDKRITQAVIASYTGLSREKVNKTMRDFESRGLVQKDELGVHVPAYFACSDFGPLNPPAEEPTVTPDEFLIPDPALFVGLLLSEGVGDDFQ